MLLSSDAYSGVDTRAGRDTQEAGRVVRQVKPALQFPSRRVDTAEVSLDEAHTIYDGIYL